MSVLVISNLSPTDEQIFEADFGHWNVSRAQRDCKAGKHQSYLFSVAEVHAACVRVEVDEDKVAAMVADSGRLDNSPPLILIVQDGMIYVIDGHHRLRALHRLGVADCFGYVIEEKDTPRYRVLYNGKATIADAAAARDEPGDQGGDDTKRETSMMPSGQAPQQPDQPRRETMTDDFSDEEAREALALAAEIKPMLAGKGPDLQSAVLLELVSLWLGGYRPDIREQALMVWLDALRDLTRVNDAWADKGRH